MAKILIVDDSMFMRAIIGATLKNLGHEIIEASNGKDMLAKYDSERPDLVTLDITMPEMDGISALKILRNEHPTALVVMCSAVGQQPIVIEALQLGAKDFIVKPFSPDKLESVITKVLQQRS